MFESLELMEVIMSVKEVNVNENFKLTLSHFYSIVKEEIGEFDPDQKLQLQASAFPLDLSTAYPWFSFKNINDTFDVGIDPKPISETLSLNTAVSLSDVYGSFISTALGLVETEELDADTLKRIDELTVDLQNLNRNISKLQTDILAKWVAYCDATMTDRGDKVTYTHWSQGEWETSQVFNLRNLAREKSGLIDALRKTEYEDADHAEVARAFADWNSPASRIRYPRFPDTEYGEEQEKFNVVYFASLPDNDSSLFVNRRLMTPAMSISELISSSIGSFSSTVSKESQASSDITTDWNTSVSGGYGPFKVKASVSSHERIQEDFKHLQSITVGARALMALEFDGSPWWKPDIFQNALIQSNLRTFERYFGESGSLLYYPIRVIIARGFNLKFSSSQNWEHEYEKDFSASGSASLKLGGFSFGGGGGYSKHEERQKVERRGHDLIMDDGEDNIRIIGYVVVKSQKEAEDFDVQKLRSRFSI